MKYLFIFLLLTITTTISSQMLLKYRATHFTSKYDNQEWSELITSSAFIVINLDQSKGTIYYDPPWMFDVIDIGDEVDRGDGESSYTFKCLDSAGTHFIFILWFLPKTAEANLYLIWDGLSLLYLTKLVP